MPIQFPNNYFDDEAWVEAGAEAFAVFIYACDYADRRSTDGLVPRAMLERVTLPVHPSVIGDAIETLLKMGVFSPAGRGNSVQITRFLEDKIGLLASDKEETRQRWADNQRRRRRHLAGNHEMCNAATCPERRKMSTVDTPGDTAVESARKSAKGSAGDSVGEFHRPLRVVTERNVTERSSGTLKRRNDTGTVPPESSGSAGAPPVDPGQSDDGRVFEGTMVQLATLLPDDLDARMPQLRVEVADGDADAVFVSLPGEDLGAAPAGGFGLAVEAANYAAVLAMAEQGWGRAVKLGGGRWFLECQAGWDLQAAFAASFEAELLSAVAAQHAEAKL